MSLSYIAQQITLYFGFFLIITGIIGNGINLLVFSTVRSYRTNPCTFYFLIASAVNIIFINTNLISRIVTVGFGIDLTQTSTSWCKLRSFLGPTITSLSLNFTCFATIDQFFITSQSANLRRLSNIKRTYQIAFIATIVWLLHGIPFFVFYDISPVTNSCTNTNYAYSIYWPIYLVTFLSVFPVLVMVVFGYLTYRNIHLTRALAEQQADRQLIRMISVQIAIVLIAFIPTGIIYTYNLITISVKKDTNQVIIEGFAASVLSVMSYMYFAGGCYMFLISSSRFRRATKERIFFCLQRNQVIPNQQGSRGKVASTKRTRT